MKTRTVLWIALAVMAALFGQQAAAGENGIPFPAGQFSTTVQGSLAICVDPSTSAPESCATTGVLVIPLTVLSYGAETFDQQGNSCGSFTEVDSNLPVDATAPLLTTNEHVAGKELNYDSTTGTGDASFTVYAGGACNGTTFDSTGATELSSGTAHIVVTDDGKRIDFLFTKLTNPAGSIGDFSLTGIDLRQTKRGS